VKRHIVVVTGSRAEYDLLYWLIRELEADDDCLLTVLVTGAHLSPEFGNTVDVIKGDGWKRTETVEMVLDDDTPAGIGKSLGLGVVDLTDAISRLSPDILVILGDRYEVLAAALAALVLSVPVAHISGGDVTEGLADELIRHAITKMSHLHFAALDSHAWRLCQMGEESWRVHVTGELNLDSIKNMEPLSRRELESQLGLKVDRRTLVVTFHPETTDADVTREQTSIILEALAGYRGSMIFTYPNADAGNRIIRHGIETFCSTRSNSGVFSCLGRTLYLNLLKYAGAMVGNSSSGIVEAPSFSLPYLHVGMRQLSRVKAGNVVCASFDQEAIKAGLNEVLSAAFHEKCAQIRNPYGDGHAAEKIAGVLLSAELGPGLLTKKFADISTQPDLQQGESLS